MKKCICAHHGHARAFSAAPSIVSMPMNTIFPKVDRLKPQSSFFTPISYYSLRLEITHPQNELFNLCLISEDNSAFLKMFETYSNKHVFIAPTLPTITAILLAPTQYEWHMTFVDLEIQTQDENQETHVTLQHFVNYEGTIHTQCLFIPERPFNEQAMIEGNEQYMLQKQHTNFYAIAFLTVGTAFFQLTASLHSALVFAFGCALGIMYQILLQYEIDRVGKHQMFVNSATRLGILSVLVAMMMSQADKIVPTDIWIGMCGFLMQKVALWFAFM